MWDERRQEEYSSSSTDQRTNPVAAPARGSSLMQTGPFNRLQRTLQLGDANNPRTTSRAVLFATITWLPLVVIAGIQGLAINSDPRKSILLDFTVYARFLVAIPLFIFGESVADRRYTMIVNYLVRSGIIASSEQHAYGDLLSVTRRLRESKIAEIVWVILAYAGAASSVLYVASSEPSTWLIASGPKLFSWAGAWYAAVSLPLFQFLFYRAVWNWIIWLLFLWRLSRLNLQLTSTHPDLSGGLNILGDSPYAMAVFVFAIGSVLSSAMVMKVVYYSAPAVIYNKVIVVYLLLSVLISFGPLLIFAGKLDGLRQRGLRDYGILASQHAQLFHEKWINKVGMTEDIVEIPLGSPDISSLSGLNTSYGTVKKVRFIPFGVRALAVIAASALIPMIPLILLEFPLQEILKAIAGFIL